MNATANDALRQQIGELKQQISELKDDNQSKEERIAELEEYRAQNECDKAEIRQDIYGRLEDRSDEDETTALEDIWLFGQPVGKVINGLIEGQDEDSNGNSENADRRSSLAQLIDLPAEKAKDVLSENQQRGRLAAQRAREIGAKTKAGLVVTSSDIADHLEKEGVNPHTETVSRVMDFITELGEDDVEGKIHKGNRIAVFDPARVEEYGTGEEPAIIDSPRDVIYSRESGDQPAPS